MPANREEQDLRIRIEVKQRVARESRQGFQRAFAEAVASQGA